MHRSLILSVSQGVSDIKKGLARTQISTEENQADFAADRSKRYRTSIIKWLTVTDPSFNYHAALKKHQPSTGEWFLELEQFRKWKDTRSSLLWLHGICKSHPPFISCLTGHWCPLFESSTSRRTHHHSLILSDYVPKLQANRSSGLRQNHFEVSRTLLGLSFVNNDRTALRLSNI